MGKPKQWWYWSVVHVIRAYPALRSAKANMQRQTMVANYGAPARMNGREVNVLLPHNAEASRTTEDMAMRMLSPREEEDIDAVSRAIEDTRRASDGAEVLRIVELVDWRRTHTIQGAALRLHMAPRTAQRRRARFVYAVAKNMGYR